MFLVNDILDYCQFKHSTLRLMIDKFNLHDTITEILSTMKIHADLNNISLILDNKLPKTLWINSDSRRITQILNNLIGNALKFTKLGGIKIKIFKKELERNLIYLKVKDTGSGMTEEII